jgi:hypothetical protein
MTIKQADDMLVVLRAIRSAAEALRLPVGEMTKPQS